MFFGFFLRASSAQEIAEESRAGGGGRGVQMDDGRCEMKKETDLEPSCPA